MSGKIFISYRRQDDPGYTHALFQLLESAFSFDSLYMDVEGHIKPGDDFVVVLKRQVADCDVLLAVIGPRWVQLLAERAGDPEDFVLLELQAAFEQGKRVIPVLVGGAAMPRMDLLPQAIASLARRNAVSLRPERFKSDCHTLISSLSEHIAAAGQARVESERLASHAAAAQRKQEQGRGSSEQRARLKARAIQALPSFSRRAIIKSTVLAGGIASTYAAVSFWNRMHEPWVRSFRGHTDSVRSVAFSPSGQYALSGGDDKNLRLWDVGNGAIARTFVGHMAKVTAVAFAADGTTAVSGSDDETIRVWHIPTAKELRAISAKATDLLVAYAPDGQTILSAGGYSDYSVQLWSAVTGAQLNTLSGHTDRIRAISYSRNGRVAVSGSNDKSVRLWDLMSGAELRTFRGHSDWVRFVGLTGDGTTVMSGDDKTVKLWNAATGEELKTFSIIQEGHISCTAFAPNDQLALCTSSNMTLTLVSLKNGAVLREISALEPPSTGASFGPSCVAFAPDSRTALAEGMNFTLKLWDLAG